MQLVILDVRLRNERIVAKQFAHQCHPRVRDLVSDEVQRPISNRFEAPVWLRVMDHLNEVS